MNKKILLKTLLPISVVGLIGGGIASSLVACSNKKNYIVLNTKEGVMEYLDKNKQHCEEKNVPYTPDAFGTGGTISDSNDYWNFIKKVYNKQAFINTILFYETIYNVFIWDGTNPKIVIEKNLLIVSYYNNDEFIKDECQIKKWNSIDDCSFSMHSEPFGDNESYDFDSNLSMNVAVISKFPEESDNNNINIDLNEGSTFWFYIWSDYPEITYSPAY